MDERIKGISDLRDESDREGIRVVIELKRGEIPLITLNNLYKLTTPTEIPSSSISTYKWGLFYDGEALAHLPLNPDPLLEGARWGQ